MKITKRQTNPMGYYVQINNRQFFLSFEVLKNTLNGQPRRKVNILYRIGQNGVLWGRSYVVVMNYETESNVAQQIAQQIAQELDKKNEEETPKGEYAKTHQRIKKLNAKLKEKKEELDDLEKEVESINEEIEDLESYLTELDSIDNTYKVYNR